MVPLRLSKFPNAPHLLHLLATTLLLSTFLCATVVVAAPVLPPPDILPSVPVPGGGGGNGGNERSSAPHVPEALNEVPMTVAETKAHPVTGADVPVGFEAKDPAVLREKAQIQALEEGVGEEREKVEGEKEGKQPSGAQQLGTQRLGSQALRSIRTSGSASLQGSKPVYVSPGSSVGLP